MLTIPPLAMGFDIGVLPHAFAFMFGRFEDAWAAQLVRFGKTRGLASEELMRLSGRIHAMETSKSWRMTAPLRAPMQQIHSSLPESSWRFSDLRVPG